MTIGELWGVMPSNTEIKVLDQKEVLIFKGHRERSSILYFWNHTVKTFHQDQDKSVIIKIV